MAETTGVKHCERHGEATRLTCVDCDTPVCPRCMVRTDVGLKCESCAEPAAAPARPARSRNRALLIMLAGLVVVAVPLWLVLSGQGDPPTGDGEEVGPPVGTWSSWPDLSSIRGTASATVLDDGRLLVAGGGIGAIPLDAAEIIDPQTGDPTPTGALSVARRGHRAVKLPDGRVLVAGGLARGELLASAEVFDPEAGTWTETGSMTTPRLGHTLTLLGDGRVLAAGGTTPEGTEVAVGGQTVRPSTSVEIYDPATGTWSRAGDLSRPRFEATATLLDGGRVLLVGGTGTSGGTGGPLTSTEIYDPAAGVTTDAGRLSQARTNHAATRLSDGRVLVVGGAGGANADTSLSSAEVFDPRRGAWTTVASLRRSRTGLTATTLEDGRVLVTGGETRSQGTRRSLASAELYLVGEDRWANGGEMDCPRSEHDAVLLEDGRVVAVAGDATFPGEAPVHSSCLDVYEPST